MTYGEIVRAQFRKHRPAVWALRLIVALALFTTYAPLFILDVPFWTSLADAPGSPWFRSLFDPAVFEEEVDVFFNILMATLPLMVAAWYLARGTMRRNLLVGALVLHLVLFAWISSARDAWRLPERDYPAQIAAVKAAGEDVSAVFPPFKHHPKRRQTEFSLTAPFSRGKLMKGAEAPLEEDWPYFLLGSDNLGNDVFARLIYGGRISLTIGILAVGIYVTIGIVFGSLAGYFGGIIDDFFMYVAQVTMVIPFLFLCLFILSVVEKPSIYYVVLVIAGVFWPTPMRLVRAEFLRQREIDYVTAARSLGISNKRVIFRHILPNALGPVFVAATFGVAATVLLESTLAFLGFSQPGVPSWGQMLRAGFDHKEVGAHLIWIGGLAIFFLVLMVNLIGEALRDALDPKMRK